MSTALRFEWHEAPPDPLPAVPFSHFQTEAWCRLLRGYGQTPHCLWVLDDRGPAASWILYTTPSDYLEPPRNRLVRRLDVHLRAMHGPVIRDDHDPPAHDRLRQGILDEVRRRAARLRPLTTDLALDPLLDEPARTAWREAAKATAWSTRPSHTYCAMLPDTVDEAFAQLKRERRTKVRKAARAGVEAIPAEDLDSLREYWAVRSETRRRNGQKPVPWGHFEQTWESLEGSGIYRVFLARQGERVGAGQIGFAWNGYLHLSGVSVAQWALDEKVPANDLLQWEVIRWAVESSFRIVDFAGAQPDSEDPKIRAIDAFKSRWGTQLVESVALALPAQRWRSRLARAAVRVTGG